MSQLDTVPTDFAPAIGIAPAEGLESEEGGRIVLEGLPNTRDVGGLPTDDGRYVKHARLLRSGALDHATARDLEVLLDDYQCARLSTCAPKKSARSIPTHRTAWWAFGSRMRRC